jgi:hypothetical protein
MVVMDVFTRSIIGFGVAAADLDGPVICRMFNRAIAKQTPPKYLSSDHDPLFRFHRWPANLRIFEVDEIKAIPGTPRSHAFVERLIGTVRREYLDRTLLWNGAIWGGSSRTTRPITTNTGVTPGWPELRRLNAVAYPHSRSQTFGDMPGGNIAMAYFTPHLPLELEFDMDRYSRYDHTNSMRSMFHNLRSVGDLRRKTTSCWRRMRFSASSRARLVNRDRIASSSWVRNATINRFITTRRASSRTRVSGGTGAIGPNPPPTTHQAPCAARLLSSVVLSRA